MPRWSKSGASSEAKARIGNAVAALVEDATSLFIDVGTTAEAAARALDRKSDLRVFTNSLHVAAAFRPDRHEVRVLGGRLGGLDGSLVGGDVVAALGGLSLDWALIGCSAIDDAGRVMDFDLEKIAVKRAAIAAAQRSALLVTREKLGRTSRAEIARRIAFDRIVSDG